MPDQILPAYPLPERFPFPVLRLVRAFRIAADVRKLFLGGLALVVLAAGNMAAGWLPYAPPATGRNVNQHAWQTPAEIVADGWIDPAPTSILASLAHPTPQGLWRLVTHWDVLLLPLRSVFEPAALLVQPGLTWTQAAWGMTRLLWALIVWAIFGGAIARMAAVQFAKDEKIRIWTALKFSLSKVLSFLCSPLLPITGIALLGALCALGGLLGRIPGAGPMIVACAWVLALALGFLMTLMLLATAVGWPLMFAAISTEGSDAFDGFSRACSFVFSRPWHYAGYALFSLIYGSLGLVFLSIVAALIVQMAAWGVGMGMGSENVAALHVTAPTILDSPAIPPRSQPAPNVATHIVGGWLFVLTVLLTGFIASYFWTASTIIYFLLRHVDDATEFDEVWLPEVEEEDDLLPLAGVAASEQQPPVERPVRAPNPEAPPQPAAGDGTSTHPAA